MPRPGNESDNRPRPPAIDVIVVGAGPAGAIAATVLARAGVRVVMFDRARFPRHKLCGDTLNPGALSILQRLDLAAAPVARGLALSGMVVTGERGVRVEGRYPEPLRGLALPRAELDDLLVRAAVAAGGELRDATAVRAAIVSGGAPRQVTGVIAAHGAGTREWTAPVVIAADGRHSSIAFALGLARHPPSPRRFAIGVQMHGVDGLSDMGEMHIRRGRYIGIAPLPGGAANVCVVRPQSAFDRSLRDPAEQLRRELSREPELEQRTRRARAVVPATVLGPLAVDDVPHTRPPDGLLLAGDACGFIDPMTGDGLRFAIGGGELAAQAALRALEHGWHGVHAWLERERRRQFAGKWRLNRVLRRLVGSSSAVWAASRGAGLAPWVVRALIVKASDCDLAAGA